MTRKHFQAVADLLAGLREYVSADTFGELVEGFGDLFSADNPRFDFDKFALACGLSND